MNVLIKIIGSVFFGWFAGVAFGLAISHGVYGGEGDHIIFILIPIMIVILFAGSFFVPKTRH